MRVIVCGTRDGLNDAQLRYLVERLRRLPDTTTIIEGGARGTDRQVAAAAIALGMGHQTFPADWTTHGKGAGPMRNQAMLDSGCDLVLAFPGPDSCGTLDMIRRAEAARIRVEVTYV